MKWISVALLLLPVAAYGQVRPQPGAGNPHLQSVDYNSDQVVLLETAPGYQLTIEFAPDEHIENVAVGDSGAWQVTANRRGDRLFVKAIQSNGATNMTVVTDARLYSFELSALSSTQSDTAWSVRFRYPETSGAAPGVAAQEAILGRYRVRGAVPLRPIGIHDDGVHTFIEWTPEQALPATYAVNDRGKESLVNGMMRDGRMVIDSVQPKLVFRIDDRSATASRLPEKP